MSDESPKRGLYFDNVVDENIDSQTILRQKNDRMIRNTIGVLFLSILVLAIVLGVNPQKMTGALQQFQMVPDALHTIVNPQKMTGTLQPSQPEDESFVYNNNLSQDIDLSQEPLQIPYTSRPIVKKYVEWEKILLVPVAKYEISGMVVGTKDYTGLSSEYDSIIFPVDLCLVWGGMEKPEYNNFITYTMNYVQGGGRACVANYPTRFDIYFLINHNSNNHIIPANKNIDEHIKSIKVGDKVVLKGLLVNVQRENGNMLYGSSLSRDDDECELIFVTKVRIGNNIYE